MTQKQESPTGDGRAFEYLAARLDASEYTRSPHDPQALAGLRQERQIEHVHALGPRVFAELLGDIARRTGQSSFIADRLQAYAALDATVLRAIGGDKFPPMPMEVVR